MAKVNFTRTSTMDKKVGGKFTEDSFSNFMHRVGYGTDNPMSQATYSLNNLMSRQRVTLEAGYRSSWLIGQAVDVIAEDMTKMGIDILSKLSPDEVKKLYVAMSDFDVWESLGNTIRWARLYGGAIAIMLIDGADYSKPIDYDKIGQKTFRGLLVLDRWMCEPDLSNLITDLNKDFGKPKFYRVHTSVGGSKLPNIKIHYSRVLRFDGITLPYYQRLMENHWGLSIVERIYDRLIAYDSATLGASQLMYRAYLRVVKINGLREALALGGREENAIIKQWDYIRQMQTNEGITMLDGLDDFVPHANSAISGAADLLQELGQQVSGATGIPLVRLFGQSPAGFNTGETDLRNYYDNVYREQENKLRPSMTKLLEVLSVSELGKRLPPDFEYKFNSLWQMSDKEMAEIATSDMTTINAAYSGGLVSKEIATKELIQSSRITGRFTNLTEDDINKAKKDDENEPPSGIPSEGMPSPSVPESEVEPSSQNKEEEEDVGISGGGVSLSSPTPEEMKAQSTMSPIVGKAQSISEKEKESQRDEVPNAIPGVKSISEVVSPLKINLNFSGMKEKIQNAAKEVAKKFFTKET
ncbi:MAG: DUF1073 domain-containing protein [Candidatus Caldatribacteriota bacterium]